jgi:DNA-binding transcriptional LysR family regulator
MLSPKVTTLLSVARTCNFSRSAEELSLTQPAVSQHIKALEGELEVQLFNRSQKEPRLTEAGKIAVAYARKMRALYQELFRELEDERRDVRRLTVGMLPTAEGSLMPRILADYGSNHPKLHISILTDTHKNLCDKLRSGEINLAVLESAVSDPNFSTILLDTDYLVLAVPVQSPLAKKNMVTLGELRQERLILRLPGSGSRSLFEAALATAGERIDAYNVILEADNNAIIKELVQAGFGVSVIPKSACGDSVRRGTIRALPVENLTMVREISLVYHRDFRHTGLIEDISGLYNDALRKSISSPQ